MQPPKVFVSHSSDDKERFVLEFAASLLAKGLDAWLDKWEMQPGDSLISKIFEEGLKDADAFIIVLSENSIKSKWVRKELNVAMVKNIESKCKVIPVVIDKVEIPSVLTDTLYHRVKNLENIEQDVLIIRDIILGISHKPSIGVAPRYLTNPIKNSQGLRDLDFFLLKKIFDWCTEDDNQHIPPTEPFLEAATENGWAQDIVINAVEWLGENRFLILHKFMDGKEYPANIHLTFEGWDVVYREIRPDYLAVMKKLACKLASEANGYENKEGRELQVFLDESSLFTCHLLDQLQRQGYIKLLNSDGPYYYVRQVSPSLQRAIEDGVFDC